MSGKSKQPGSTPTNESARPWTQSELAYLRRNYLHQTIDETARALDRKRGAVRKMAAELGCTRPYHRLRSSEVEAVRRPSKSKSWPEVAKTLGISMGRLNYIVLAGGIPRAEEPPFWTPHEDDTLRRLFGTHSIAELVRTLRRTPPAVQTRTNLLGLRRRGQRPWSSREDRRLRREYRNRDSSSHRRARRTQPPRSQ